MTHSPAGLNPDLLRVIGVRALALTAFNYIVGSGIFGLPAPVAGILGPQAIAAYLTCALLVGLIGLCLAEAGSRVTRAGGIYAYADEAFGPLVGWVAATLLWFFNCALASAAVANLLMDTLASVFPLLQSPAARAGVLVALYVTLATINIRGVKLGVRVTEVVGIVKAVPLVAFVLVGLWFVEPANLRWTAVPGPVELGQGATLLFFAFMGIEGALCTSGEVRDPGRTIPRAIFAALLMVTALYVGVHLVVQGVLGGALATTSAPLVATANLTMGPLGASFVVLATVLSTCGFFTSDALSSPRVLYALGRDGQMPAALGRVHASYRTPAVAIAVYAMVAGFMALTGTFRQLVVVSSAGTLLLYLICCVAVLRLRAKQVTGSGVLFVVPGGPAIPLLAVLVIAWFLFSLPLLELAAAAGGVVLMVIVFFLRGGRPLRPASVES